MFHLHISYTSRKSGSSSLGAVQYIARQGRYANRPDRVRMVQSLHMPAWSGGPEADCYWRAAEGKWSRINARTAIKIEFALPRGLSPLAQNQLALAMAERLSSLDAEKTTRGGKRPLTLAVHEGFGRNPHAHVVLSTSVNDGVARCQERWFRRYRREQPANGGAPRCELMKKRAWLLKVRKLWADLANRALLANGLPPSLDHRSHRDRGLATAPTKHRGPLARRIWTSACELSRADRAKMSEELEAAQLRYRLDLDQAEADHQALLAAQMVQIDELLCQHPLSSNSFIRSARWSVILLDPDISSQQALIAKTEARRKGTGLIGWVPSAWATVRSSDACWALDPQTGAAVMLARFHAVTDGTELECSEALVRIARGLDLVKPMVALAPWAPPEFRKLFDEAGIRIANREHSPILQEIHRVYGEGQPNTGSKRVGRPLR